jgi:hypothetical protein
MELLLTGSTWSNKTWVCRDGSQTLRTFEQCMPGPTWSTWILKVAGVTLGDKLPASKQKAFAVKIRQGRVPTDTLEQKAPRIRRTIRRPFGEVIQSPFLCQTITIRPIRFTNGLEKS